MTKKEAEHIMNVIKELLAVYQNHAMDAEQEINELLNSNVEDDGIEITPFN